MDFFFLFLVLAVIGVKAKPRAQADASAGGNAQVGGCSLGAGVEGTADGNAGSVGGKVSADGCDDTSQKYTYTISANRIDQVVAPGNPVLYMYYQISDPQNITYLMDINDDNPLELEIYVTNEDADYVYESDSQNRINACTDPDDGTWDYVAVKVIQGGLMPDGQCPVETGSYDIDQAAGDVTVTFPKKISCGDYVLYANLYSGETWAIQVGYSFNIPDDDNCLSTS